MDNLIQPGDANAFDRIVLHRRSVRSYDSTPVPESVMRECLELALLAPNSSNLQAWEFYWVRSEEKKRRLAEYCMAQGAARLQRLESLAHHSTVAKSK